MPPIETIELENKPKPQPWVPISNPVHQAILGKVTEEAGEVVSVTARCGIQGLSGVIPGKDKTNFMWLRDEMADLYAAMFLLCNELFTDHDLEMMQRRIDMKKKFLNEWVDGLREETL
jgi:NTP pyrophosphatase (non-canonical NTP hydrolase)